MTKDDANADLWKEKFITGLPTLFAQTVKDQITRKHGGTYIPYSQYTCGAHISECIVEGLSLCNDIKLQAQLKAQNLTGRKEIGEFCDQFGYDLQLPCASKQSSKPKEKHSHHKSHKNKLHKTSSSTPSTFRTATSKQPPKCSTNISQVVFDKCGKTGHYVNKCWTKKKLNEIADEGIHKQILIALLNTTNDEEKEEDEN